MTRGRSQGRSLGWPDPAGASIPARETGASRRLAGRRLGDHPGRRRRSCRRIPLSCPALL